ncbi:MAG: hypothetical protein ABSC30_10255 [Acidimicrobiales bacterium]
MSEHPGPIDLAEMVVEATHRFQTPKAEVWNLLSDVGRMAGLGPEHVVAHWLDSGLKVGATFTGKNRRDGFEWEVQLLPARGGRAARTGWGNRR